MKKVVFALLMVMGIGPCEAGLGETRAECLKRYGRQVDEWREKGKSIVYYKWEGLLVTATFPGDDPGAKCINIFYANGPAAKKEDSAMASALLKKLFLINQGGENWRACPIDDGDDPYIDPRAAPESFFVVKSSVRDWESKSGDFTALYVITSAKINRVGDEGYSAGLGFTHDPTHAIQKKFDEIDKAIDAKIEAASKDQQEKKN